MVLGFQHGHSPECSHGVVPRESQPGMKLLGFCFTPHPCSYNTEKKMPSGPPVVTRGFQKIPSLFRRGQGKYFRGVSPWIARAVNPGAFASLYRISDSGH